jgi:phosphoribosylformylglycinamidine cyclo-ligase
MSLSYESSGVRYDQLDTFKRACQAAARVTVDQLTQHAYREPAAIRGESAYLIEGDDHYLAHVEEGLGTKNLVADAMQALTGQCYYRAVAIDTVATIVNDLVTCGALPISIAMHAAVGDSEWFSDEERAKELVAGWAEGCRLSSAVWGGGETPTLKGMIDPKVIVLAGSAVGKVAPKENRITGEVHDGDAVIFLASSGVQTNGLTLCRKIAGNLPDGYLTRLSDDTLFGEALLAPSVIYVAFVKACLEQSIKLNYLAHVTGHGWRKLMRLDEPFVYEIDRIRPTPPLFEFLMKAGPIEMREAFATFNMGVGFAAIVAPEAAEQVVDTAVGAGYDAWLAGRVRSDGNRKAVVVPELNLIYEGDTLNLR